MQRFRGTFIFLRIEDWTAFNQGSSLQLVVFIIIDQKIVLDEVAYHSFVDKSLVDVVL